MRVNFLVKYNEACKSVCYKAFILRADGQKNGWTDVAPEEITGLISSFAASKKSAAEWLLTDIWTPSNIK